MSTLRTTQPKRKLNLVPTTLRVLSSPDLDSWCAGAPLYLNNQEQTGAQTYNNCNSFPVSMHPHQDCPTRNCQKEEKPSPPNPPPRRRGDGAA